jgi:hypothetical protein
MALRAPRTTVATLAALALSTSLGLGCKDKPLPAPDPDGKDLIAGAVVAAVTKAEATPGIRTYKILHVDDYPKPLGYSLHLAAYDPKADTFEAAVERRRLGGMTVVNGHFEVRMADWLKRDYRIIAQEPLTEAELAPYIKARDHK